MRSMIINSALVRKIEVYNLFEDRQLNIVIQFFEVVLI